MKVITSRKIRLNYHLVLENKGKRIVDTRKRIKSKILCLVNSAQWENGKISVGYGDDFYNESLHPNKESLLRALCDYTEKPLLEFFINTEKRRDLK